MSTQQEAMTQVYTDLQELTMKHDSKILAAVMMNYSAQLLQAIMSAGAWTQQDVIDIIRESIKDVTTPLPADKMPKVVAVDSDGVSLTATSGRLN